MSAVALQGVELPLQPSGVSVLTRATLPPVALMLIGESSLTSVPIGAPVPAPGASRTSKY